MPLWLYDRPLYVIKEKGDTVVVRCNNNEFYTYERVYKKTPLAIVVRGVFFI